MITTVIPESEIAEFMSQKSPLGQSTMNRTNQRAACNETYRRQSNVQDQSSDEVEADMIHYSEESPLDATKSDENSNFEANFSYERTEVTTPIGDEETGPPIDNVYRMSDILDKLPEAAEDPGNRGCSYELFINILSADNLPLIKNSSDGTVSFFLLMFLLANCFSC